MAPKRKQPIVAAKTAQPIEVWAAKVKNGKKTNVLTSFNPNVKVPIVIDRNMEAAQGPRHACHPSKLARAQGKYHAAEVAWPDSYDPPSDWEGYEDMPNELKAEDCCWIPGPAIRPLPPFQGPKPGPTDQSLDHNSVSRC